MSRAVKEIKQRLRKAGFPKNSVRVSGYSPAYIRINLGLEGKIKRDEMKKITAQIFGDEYAEKKFPSRIKSLYIVPQPWETDDMLPHLFIQKREAEAQFGWREKKIFCSCGAVYDLNDEKGEKCALFH